MSLRYPPTFNHPVTPIYRPHTNINSMIYLADLHYDVGIYCYSSIVLNAILSHLLYQFIYVCILTCLFKNHISNSPY